MHAVDPKTLRFDVFALDLSRCLVRRGSQEIPLRPKAFDVLRYLAENAGRLVSKDELIPAIWRRIVVTDDSLVQCIKEIREALCDAEHRIIKTVPRRGYVFAVEVSSGVTLVESPAADEVRRRGGRSESDMSRWWHRFWVGAGVVLIIIGVVVGRHLLNKSSAPSSESVAALGQSSGTSQIPAPRQSIAVLPLVLLSEPSRDDYFADGMTEDIISALGRFSEISVRSRNAVFPYKGKTPRPEEVGRDLAVRYVLEGSVRRSAERIRLAVQLTDTARGVVLWSEQYDIEPKDIFAVQDDITRRIAGTLAIRLTSLELARIATKAPSNLEAYDLVLRGRDLLSRVTRNANSQARLMFERALALDPSYASAYVGLGLVDLSAVANGWTADADVTLLRVENLGRRALSLDNLSASARALLGETHLRRVEYDRALDEFRRALELNPSDADSHAGLGNALLCAGEIEGAIKALETATQFQPYLRMSDYVGLGTAYLLAGRNADAIRTLERSLERYESIPYPHVILAAAYFEAGRQEDAAREAGTVRRLSPFFNSADYGSLFRHREHRERIASSLQKAGL